MLSGNSYPQACAHYYSAIEEHRVSPTDSLVASPTPVQTQMLQTIRRSSTKTRHGKDIPRKLVCDATLMSIHPHSGKTIRQIVSWIPDGDDCGIASKNWGGFCNKNDGGLGGD